MGPPVPRPIAPPNAPPGVDLHGWQPKDRIPIVGRPDPTARRYYGKLLPRAQALVGAQPTGGGPPAPVPPASGPPQMDVRPHPLPTPEAFDAVANSLGTGQPQPPGQLGPPPRPAGTPLAPIPKGGPPEPTGPPTYEGAPVGPVAPPGEPQVAQTAVGPGPETQRAKRPQEGPGYASTEQVQGLCPGQEVETEHGTAYRAPDGNLRVRLNAQGQEQMRQAAQVKLGRFRAHPLTRMPGAPPRPVVPGKPDYDPFTDEWID